MLQLTDLRQQADRSVHRGIVACGHRLSNALLCAFVPNTGVSPCVKLTSALLIFVCSYLWADTNMEKLTCVGCKSPIPNKDFISCFECKQKYDLICANLSPKRFKKMSQEVKVKWVCLECKSRKPKLDNTNTPVRVVQQSQLSRPVADTEVMLDDCLTNVTVRKQRIDDYITENRLKEIWKNMMRKELETLLESTIDRKISENLKTIHNQYEEFQKSVTYISGQFEDFKKENSELRKLLSSTSSELKVLKKENEALKENLSSIANRVKALEDETLKQQQWVRLQNIEITGIPECKGEDTFHIVQKVVHHLGVTIDPSEIEFAHRVQPRRVASAERARPIVARLRSRITKDQIIASARKHRNMNTKDLGMGGENTRIFVNEHLIKENKILLSLCKQKAKEVNYKYIWTKNCRIYVRKSEMSPAILINSSTDVSRMV